MRDIRNLLDKIKDLSSYNGGYKFVPVKYTDVKGADWAVC